VRVLVTGASGFIGSALTDHLVQARRFLVRAAVRSDAVVMSSCIERTVAGEIGPDTDWFRPLADVDVVVHLAARVHVMREAGRRPLSEFRRVNVAGTLNLARQAVAASVKRFVFVSSVKVNGDSGCFTEEDAPAPADPYGISKHEAELGLMEMAERGIMEVVIIRPPLVYGPGVEANFQALMRAVARGVPLPVGAARNRRSLVALDNLLSFIAACIEHPAAANETFFVSDGEDLSTPDLIRRLGRALGRPARLVPVPVWVLTLGAAAVGRRDLVRRLVGTLQVDVSKARRLLGWAPPISVDEGLRRAAVTH
jgi:UDP-N-acetyl-alpha-D-quinovosamine dehydrogenase